MLTFEEWLKKNNYYNAGNLADIRYGNEHGKQLRSQYDDYVSQYNSDQKASETAKAQDLSNYVNSASTGMEALKSSAENGDSSSAEKYIDNLIAQENTASAREYETTMSNTAIQRAAADASAAGINPTYYLTNGGSASSTPSVATSAVQSSGLKAELANSMNIAKLQAQTSLQSAKIAAQASENNSKRSFWSNLLGSAVGTAGKLGASSIYSSAKRYF